MSPFQQLFCLKTFSLKLESLIPETATSICDITTTNKSLQTRNRFFRFGYFSTTQYVLFFTTLGDSPRFYFVNKTKTITKSVGRTVALLPLQGILSFGGWGGVFTKCTLLSIELAGFDGKGRWQHLQCKYVYKLRFKPI